MTNNNNVCSKVGSKSQMYSIRFNWTDSMKLGVCVGGGGGICAKALNHKTKCVMFSSSVHTRLSSLTSLRCLEADWMTARSVSSAVKGHDNEAVFRERPKSCDHRMVPLA